MEILTSRKIVILSILLIIPYGIFAMDFLGFFQKIFTGTDNTPTSLSYILFGWLITFIFLYILPTLFLKKENINQKEIGSSKGNIKWGKIIIFFSFLAIPLLFFGTNDPELIAHYPLTKDVLGNLPLFIIYEIMYGLLYYLPYEFFFRGFVQLGLSKNWGTWKSIIYVTIITTILHIPKPLTEIISAAVVGILFGYLAKKSESWLYIFEVHFLVGILTDTYCSLRFLGVL